MYWLTRQHARCNNENKRTIVRFLRFKEKRRVYSPLITLETQFWSWLTSSSSFWHIHTELCFCSSVKNRGTNFVKNCRIFCPPLEFIGLLRTGDLSCQPSPKWYSSVSVCTVPTCPSMRPVEVQPERLETSAEAFPISARKPSQNSVFFPLYF